MPMFDYRCNACGHKFEELVSRSTPDADVSCPRCKEKNASKLLSRFAMGGSASGGGGSFSSGSSGSSGSSSCGSFG